MILNTAPTIMYNGSTVQTVLYNGITVWAPEPGDGVRVCVNNTSPYAQNISAGLRIFTGSNVLVYSHEPTTASYTSTKVPVGARIYCQVLTDTGYRSDLSATGVSGLRYQMRYLDSDYASAAYTANITDEASIDLYDYGVNTFYVSGETNYSREVTGGFWDAHGAPLTVTYVSGDSSISGLSANRTMSYYYADGNGRHDSQRSVVYLADKTYSAISASASASARMGFANSSCTARLSASVCVASALESSYKSKNGGIAKYVSFTIQTATTASKYRPSASSISTDNACHWTLSAHMSNTQTYTATLNGVWSMSGIAP